MTLNLFTRRQDFRYAGYRFLPVIEHAANLFPKNHLQDAYLISCQHILPSTHMMIRSMIELGLRRDRIALIGKCYSTNQKTMENMLSEGIFVCDSSNKFDPHQSFDQQFHVAVKAFLHKQINLMKPSRDSQIIILDDGGELLLEAQKLTSYYTNITGVEQTSSGYRRIMAANLDFPVMNVAQSSAKLSFESPLIAESVFTQLDKKLKLSCCSPKEVLIVGNGPIGSALYTLLQTHFTQHNVATYDALKELSNIQHYPNFNAFDLIIGATGNRAMSYHYYDTIKKGAVLASISSSDREFNAVYFRKLSAQILKTHDDVSYNGLTLLNCGFPLNFSGEDSVSIPLKYIQFVCALLLLGVCTAVGSNRAHKGLIELCNEDVNSIVGNFAQHVV